ncbi:protein phosphatase 2C domain-containing protein [Streptomyces sp. 549]|uniref:protein phosphatase 2C domain-containing protein n=1 Tax=Streptomyces sp. 549 TaxID=3049076 RepID=UPI0024C3E7F0|nr:protein phosphatase 2C domain-containing protein [Streptomyces sp. 549]MDK1474442.1 protein phosphatase 2C domain-containing protein [Streptomyces sp. 549]
MPQLDQLSACPSCAEPLEHGDRFCGVCGTDLAAAAGVDRPTMVIGCGEQAPVPPPPPPPAAPAPAPPAAPAPAPAPPAPPAPAPPAASPPPAHGPYAPAEPPNPPAGGPPPPPPAVPPTPPAAAGGPPPPGPPPPAPAQPVPTPTLADFTLSPPDPRAGLRTRAGAQAAAAPSPAVPAGQRACAACGAGAVDRDGYCETCGHAQPRERDHMETELHGVAAASDRGLRHHRNEDAYGVDVVPLADGSPAVVAVVCDGVSSSSRPEEASAAAAEAACGHLNVVLPRGAQPQQALHESLEVAARAVSALAAEGHSPEQNAPACTMVSAVVAGGLLSVGWIGDSRAYWIPEDRAAPAARLTEDDSWAAQMVAAGLMEEAEAYADPRAHAITGWLGADSYELDPHTASFTPDRAGVVLVCTDGLWNYAEAAEQLAAVVPADARARPMAAARFLVEYALSGGGHDNVTVAVIPFPATAARAGSA